MYNVTDIKIIIQTSLLSIEFSRYSIVSGLHILTVKQIYTPELRIEP